jgi:hypothetical protein
MPGWPRDKLKSVVERGCRLSGAPAHLKKRPPSGLSLKEVFHFISHIYGPIESERLSPVANLPPQTVSFQGII